MIMLLQLLLYVIELGIDLWHSLFHGRIFRRANCLVNALLCCPSLRTFLGNLLWSTNTCHDILTLGVYQILTIEDVLARSGVTAEAYTRCGCVTHVSEYHRHDRDCGSPLCWNTFHLTIKDGTLIHPTVEYGTDSAPKLFHWVVWEFLTSLLADSYLESLDELFQLIDVHLVVQLDITLSLHVHDDGLEWVDIILVDWFHAQYDITVHLYETTITIVSEALVGSLASQTLNHLVVKS